MTTAPETTVNPELKLNEYYLSIQGEGIHSGLLCFFIRTAGCDLRCRWCDTEDALNFENGKYYSPDDIIKLIPADINLLQITGGEPLLQKKPLLETITAIHRARPSLKILLETGGHRSLVNIPNYVHTVMDIKLPSSGEEQYDFKMNFDYLKKSDEIKFVIASHSDFNYAVKWVEDYRLSEICNVLFSPQLGSLAPKLLADWIIKKRLPVRMQIQLHKIIWGINSSHV